MKGSIPIWVAAFVLWTFGGYFLGRSICCGGAAAVGAATSGAALSSLYIGDAGLAVASADQSLMFKTSGSEPIIADKVAASFEKVAAHVKANPEKMLYLTGLYQYNERNTSDQDNLGLGRADQLRAYFVDNLDVPAEQIIISSSREEDLPTDSEKRIHGGMMYDFLSDQLSISDGGEFHKSAEDNFEFSHSDFNFKEPLSDELDDLFSAAAEYVKGNEKLKLRITGLQAEDETSTKESEENLGFARAEEVKKIFSELGVDDDQIILSSALISNAKFKSNMLRGGIHLDILGAPQKAKAMTNTSPSKLKDVAKSAVGTVTGAAASAVAVAGNAADKVVKTFTSTEDLEAYTATIHFSSGEKTLSLTDEQESFMKALIQHLDDNSSAKVEVVGHTDNQGTAVDNGVAFGRARARIVRAYLQERGINKSQIRIDSDGAANPIASNDTEEGRAQNRRVEIRLR